MKLVILITAKNEYGLEIAEAWQKAGAPGVTIVSTHGLHTLQQQVRSGNLELPRLVVSMASAMAHIMEDSEEKGNLFLSVVEDDLVDNLLEGATQFLGDVGSHHLRTDRDLTGQRGDVCPAGGAVNRGRLPRPVKTARALVISAPKSPAAKI